MKSRAGHGYPGVLKRGRAYAAAIVVLAFSVACSVTTGLLPSATPTPPQAQVSTETQAPKGTQASTEIQAPNRTQASTETQAPTQTLAPTQGAPRGLIAYAGNDGNIYTIDRDGKQKTAVTLDANLSPGPGQAGLVYQNPTWAPNGQMLAFMGFTRTDQVGAQASLYTASADGKKRVEAFSSQDSFPFYLFWSPNSQYVTFLSNAATGSDLALNLAAAAGGDSKIIGTGQPYYWDWAPDNRSIIVHTGGAAANNPAARMAFLELDGSVQKRELDLKPGAFQAPAWSPGGDELVLAAANGSGGQELVLAGRDGAVKRVLAQFKGQAAFAWSPKADSLAYTAPAESDPTGLTSRLVLLDPAQPERAKEVARGSVLAFFWSPDDQKIAYFLLASSQPGQTSQSVAPASHVVFQANPGVNLDVEVYDLASGGTRKAATFSPTDSFQQVFPYFDQYQRSGTIWSPDSQNLVLAGLDSIGNPAIYVVGLAGGSLKKIADGDLAFWSWK